MDDVSTARCVGLLLSCLHSKQLQKRFFEGERRMRRDLLQQHPYSSRDFVNALPTSAVERLFRDADYLFFGLQHCMSLAAKYVQSQAASLYI